MGRVNTVTGQGLTARLVLLRTDPDDAGRIPASAYDGEIEVISPGLRVFRRSDERVFIVWKIAASTIGGTRYVLVVVYTPGPTRDAQAPFIALAADFGVELVKSWAVSLHADGTLRVPALDADATAIGTGVKGAWPASWIISAGVRFLAEVIA